MAADAIDLSELKRRRDQKVSVVVRLTRPAWLIDVKALPETHTLLFDLIFRPTPSEGWYRRRYEYDGEANVLHHRGEVVFPESELSALPDAAELKL